MFERTGLCYIKNVPEQLPKGGRVLVHNCVHAEWQDQKPGVNGFRCWTTRSGRHSNMEPCDCGWSGLPHYRIPREGYENPPNVTGRIRPADHANDVIGRRVSASERKLQITGAAISPTIAKRNGLHGRADH
jgi:hypothetical protein